jgi:hypothetical protein
VVRGRCLRSSVTGGAAAHIRTAGALARGCQAGSAASSAECRGVGGSTCFGSLLVDVHDRPAETGEVAGDSDRDRDERALAALVVEAPPDLAQSLLGFPGDRDRDLGLVFLAALELGREPWWAAGRGTTSARSPRGSFSDAALPNPA